MKNYRGIASLITSLTLERDNRLTGASLCLCKADVADADGNVAATYTAQEADFGGYARITLNSWGAVAADGSGIAKVEETIRTFTATGATLPQDIYVAFILDPAGLLVSAERFTTGPVHLTAAGDTVPYKPVQKLTRV